MCVVLAFVLKFIAHTAILNAYLNMMAELMGFADRQFFSVSECVLNKQSSYSLPLLTGMVDMYHIFLLLSKVELACPRLDTLLCLS